MFCMKCGTKLPDGAVFCFKCGNKVVSGNSTESQAQSVQKQNLEGVQKVEQSVKPVSRMEKLQRAAEAGNVMAQVNLADALMNGRGCEKDEQKALVWYQKAAEQGDTDARAAIGLYEQQQKQLAEEKEKKEIENMKNETIDFLDNTILEMEKSGAEMFFMLNSNNVHSADTDSDLFIDSELLNSAINTYAFGTNPNDVKLLVDDTVLATSGTIGLIVTSKSIITSRHNLVHFCDIDSVEVNGFDIDVTHKNGTVETIYNLDVLNEEERENLGKYLDAVVKLSKGR